MSLFYRICLVLVLIGGLNWGLVGLFDFNLVSWICGGFNWASRLIYILVGVGALCAIPTLFAPELDPGAQPHHA